jgi:hypothetical protein
MDTSETRLCMSKDLELGLMKVQHGLWRTGMVTRRVHFQVIKFAHTNYQFITVSLSALHI